MPEQRPLTGAMTGDCEIDIVLLGTSPLNMKIRPTVSKASVLVSIQSMYDKSLHQNTII